MLRLFCANLLISCGDGVGRCLVALLIKLALNLFTAPFVAIIIFLALFIEYFITLKLLRLLLSIPDSVAHLDQTLLDNSLLRVCELQLIRPVRL